MSVLQKMRYVLPQNLTLDIGVNIFSMLLIAQIKIQLILQFAYVITHFFTILYKITIYVSLPDTLYIFFHNQQCNRFDHPPFNERRVDNDLYFYFLVTNHIQFIILLSIIF